MIREDARRICGLEHDDRGTYAAVWLAQDPQTHRIRVYDCAMWRHGEVLAVLAEGLNARGRWIPIAWADEVLAEKLRRDHKLAMLPAPAPVEGTSVELASRELLQMMRARIFTVDAHCAEWQQEFKTYTKFDDRVPTEGYPMMAATRHAVQCLVRARAQSNYAAQQQKNYPKISLV